MLIFVDFWCRSNLLNYQGTVNTGLVAGWCLLALYAVLGTKSLCLLVETAKHVDAASYEVLAEAAFGRRGFLTCNALMFVMSWGPMLSYLMLVKENLGALTGWPGRDCLVAASLCVMLPLCLQRDMADLAKTSRVSVLFNVTMVLSETRVFALCDLRLPSSLRPLPTLPLNTGASTVVPALRRAVVAAAAPTAASVADAGGLAALLARSTFRPATCFAGLGVVSFAFSCQHAALIVAGSMANPTRERWTRASRLSFAVVFALAVVIGTCGYVGFREESRGNILRNFPDDSE